MPFLASVGSRVREHRDWFVRDDRSGEPITVVGWSPEPERLWSVLDLSNPDVLEHLRMLFTTLYDWGFRYFKLDGLGFSTPVGIRRDEQATSISAYRDGLRVIRESVKDSAILICGPELSGPRTCRICACERRYWNHVGDAWSSHRGVPDASDPSEPVSPSLPGLRIALLYTLSRWWTFDVLYQS